MFEKHHDGRYQVGQLTIQYPVSPDEAQYAYHLCQWVIVDRPRAVQQVCSRKIEDGKAWYQLGYSYEWFAEETIIGAARV